ncbi:FIP1[V]-like protein [Cornus florida]|uniref:FIP1[V]-like protein n=1 Tax=Cornus florida TaxID=4283 RepID=UPI00289DFAF4|nr:FIP1[V]-like protein [Cornus florida]
MEDDDEFGDLYTDVLRPLTSSSASQPPPIQSTPPNLSHPIDLKIQSDHEEITHGTPDFNFTLNFSSSNQNYALVSDSDKTAPKLILAGSLDSHRNLNVDDELENQEVDKREDLAGVGNNWASDSIGPNESRVLESVGDVKLQKRAFDDPNYADESGIDVVVDEGDDKDDFLVEKDEILAGKSENFDVKEVDTGIGDLGSEQIIPGLSIPGVSDAVDNFRTRDDATGEGDGWDSDSEDDLQIVLNDNNNGPRAMDRTGVMGTDDDDEDEDGDPLVIVADSDPNHQPIHEQEWGEDAAQGTDGERQELGDAAKVIGVAVAPKIGYNNHGYHPFHSQFKYVRPGVEPMPGSVPAGPGGVPGQVRPPINMAPIAGRGRGDWRPTGRGASSMQKNFHPGFGMPVWGNNTSGRAFGSGLEFTLPSHKTIFDVEVDSFEEKPWRLTGIEISDFFNFDLNEESWKDYCKLLAQLRLEATMQSKIRVYESGRREQEYDPDLPPELAAAAGFHDVPSENVNLGRTDAGQSDLAKGSVHVRPSLPTGRAIQVESGFGERLPSIDTRPPRIRDSDAIIEIVLQDSTDDNSFPDNDVVDRPENDPAREDVRGDHAIEGDIEYLNGLPHTCNGRKGELVGQRAPFMNSVCDNIIGTVHLHSEAPSQCHPDSREVNLGRNLGIPREKRWSKGRANDKSPNMTPSEDTQDKRMCDNQKEGSVESIGGKHSPLLSPISDGTAMEPDVEHGDGMHEELVLADGTSTLEREEIALIEATDVLKDENSMHSVKKLSSRIEQPYLQGIDDGEDLQAARSSENSKARSGSSRDYQKLRDGVEEEEVQDEHSTRMLNIKRPHGEDEQRVRRKGRDERRKFERHRMVVEVRDDSYSRRDRDPISAHKLHAKRKERDNSDGAWQWRDDDSYGKRTRTEHSRKRERSDETGSRHQAKVRESERGDRDERLQLRKQLDNSSWRGHHDKDIGSRYRERDDNLRSRCEKMNDLNSKRREEEKYLRRDHADKEEILHGHRENTTHRKRERDEVLDQWKRDDHARIMDDDHHFRHTEEGWFQRERSEKQRDRDELLMPKQLNEVSSSKRERDGGGGGIRCGRATEDKVLFSSHGRVKYENKGSDRDYQFKDTGKQSEQLKGKDRVESGSSQHRGHQNAYARGIQLSNDERKSRQERTSTRNDRVSTASDNHRAYQKEQKDNPRKSKESEGGDHNSFGRSKRKLEDHSGHISDTGNDKNEIPVNHRFSRKHKEDASSDEEHQDSRRGRSKLERWTCHKERDISNSATSSPSLKVEGTDRYNDAGSSLAGKLPDKSSKMVESIDNQHPFHDEKDAGNLEISNVNVKATEDKELDTVAKLKKRSERFKLPMPSEKDALAVKKMESEPLPSVQSDTHADSEIKQERPARKRRWVSN